MVHEIEGVMVQLSSFFNGAVGLWRRVSLETPNILGCDKPGVVAECHLRTARSIDNMRGRNGLNVNEIQTNASSAYPIRLSTIKAPTQGLVTLEVPFTTGQASGADSLGLCVCYFRGLFAVCAGRAG